jgi:hypothetical protein
MQEIAIDHNYNHAAAAAIRNAEFDAAQCEYNAINEI